MTLKSETDCDPEVVFRQKRSRISRNLFDCQVDRCELERQTVLVDEENRKQLQNYEIIEELSIIPTPAAGFVQILEAVTSDEERVKIVTTEKVEEPISSRTNDKKKMQGKICVRQEPYPTNKRHKQTTMTGMFAIFFFS